MVRRLVTMDITIQGKEFVIINIYGPNHDNDNALFEKLNEIVDIEKNIIIGGDFNTVLNTNIDKRNGRKDTNKKCRNKINKIIENYNIVDI